MAAWGWFWWGWVSGLVTAVGLVGLVVWALAAAVPAREVRLWRD